MARNKDGSVTLKTTGKVATTPSGSGRGNVHPQAQAVGGGGAKVVGAGGKTGIAGKGSVVGKGGKGK